MDPAIGYAFALVFILVGLAGMVLPALPGVPLVFEMQGGKITKRYFLEAPKAA